jgi:O-antigen/teichoic acid export membrane protein
MLLGDAYRAAWPVFMIQGWACLFLFSGMIRANYLALRSAPGTQVLVAVLTLGSQILLNYALVPRFGISGAALAFLVSQAFSAWALPALLPALRPCLRPQLRSLLAPWRPGSWREFLAAVTH